MPAALGTTHAAPGTAMSYYAKPSHTLPRHAKPCPERFALLLNPCLAIPRQTIPSQALISMPYHAALRSIRLYRYPMQRTDRTYRFSPDASPRAQLGGRQCPTTQATGFGRSSHHRLQKCRTRAYQSSPAPVEFDCVARQPERCVASNAQAPQSRCRNLLCHNRKQCSAPSTRPDLRPLFSLSIVARLAVAGIAGAPLFESRPAGQPLTDTGLAFLFRRG